MVPLLADKVIDPTFSNFRASGTQIADPDHTVCLLEIAYGVMASAYLKLGEKTKAKEIFQHALALNPNYPHVLNNLGALAAQDGRIAEAEALFLRAKEIMGRREMSPHANLGNIYEMTGRIRDALRMYETAVALKPEFGSSWYTVARLRVLSGDPAGAYSPLARAIALDEGWRARAARSEPGAGGRSVRSPPAPRMSPMTRGLKPIAIVGLPLARVCANHDPIWGTSERGRNFSLAPRLARG